MIIQLNADKNLSISEEYSEKLKGILTKELDRFADLLTRVELHFTDENATRKTKDDKKCTLEAKLKTKQPIAVSDFGDTYDNATTGALLKLKSALDTAVGKMRVH